MKDISLILPDIFMKSLAYQNFKHPAFMAGSEICDYIVLHGEKPVKFCHPPARGGKEFSLRTGIAWTQEHKNN